MGISKTIVIISIIIAICGFLPYVFAENCSISKADSALESSDSTTGLSQLAELLHNGKPTLVYFYQSVACSCTAARCVIANDELSRNASLNATNDKLNFISIDYFYEAEAESLYQCQVVPLIVGFDKNGQEISRAEWDINAKIINDIIAKIKE